MAKMIDAQELLEWYRPYYHMGDPIPFEVLAEDIQSMTREAAQVVYCKDCALWKTVGCALDGLHMHISVETDFCSRGKRRQ